MFVHLAGRLRIPPADGLAEQVRTASCDHGIERRRLHLAEEQIASVAYGFWPHRMTGSAAEANRFTREYGATYTPSPTEQDHLPKGAGAAGGGPPTAPAGPPAGTAPPGPPDRPAPPTPGLPGRRPAADGAGGTPYRVSSHALPPARTRTMPPRRATLAPSPTSRSPTRGSAPIGLHRP
ncbi:DUF6417 family protein [Streptomyces sp. NBC_01571]|uniref:DUF6417 family protein n=1 Tax=Streptomyces sp. NBC_01571 TaxID=2975883 RepID=UPI002B1CCEDF|nr:DUF6417 family protein [Streptomyces sp. NBC_01571]